MYIGSLILLNGYPSEDVPAGPAHLVQGVCPAGQHLRAGEERHKQNNLHYTFPPLRMKQKNRYICKWHFQWKPS